jgi:hypothetical protein
MAGIFKAKLSEIGHSFFLGLRNQTSNFVIAILVWLG